MTLQDLLLIVGIPLAGWVIKEAADIRPLKEKVDHLVQRVDALYEHLIEPKDRS